MIFIRHAVTEAGPDVCYGRLDLGLGDGAEQQMATCLASLPRAPAVVTSPLSRCRILAERIATRDGVTLRIEPRLVEYDFGEWEGRRWADIPRTQSEPWTDDILNAAPPGGERFTDLIARVRAALVGIAEGTVVVAHAGPIRAARIIRTGVSFDEVFAQKIPYCEPLHVTRTAA